MRPLTGRTGVQIKAALSIIHARDMDVASIERQAENAMRTGRAQVRSYDIAISNFLDRNPAIRPLVERVVKVISRSDDATVAKYGAAIDAYIYNDDTGPMDALASMMKNDMQALAVRDGELSVDDAVAGRVDWAALGVPGFADYDGAASASGEAVQPQSAPERFSFTGQSQAVSTGSPWDNQAGASVRSVPAEDRRRAAHDATTRPGQGARDPAATASSLRDAWSNQAGASASPRRAAFDARAEMATIGDARPIAGETN